MRILAISLNGSPDDLRGTLRSSGRSENRAATAQTAFARMAGMEPFSTPFLSSSASIQGHQDGLKCVRKRIRDGRGYPSLGSEDD